MKKNTILVLWLTFLCGTVFGQQNRLTLLSPTNNFNLDILNGVCRRDIQPTEVIMLEIEQGKGNLNEGIYELRITSIHPVDFLFFELISDKYIGYFEYREHNVMVYGNVSADPFFAKTVTQKEFSFLPLKPGDRRTAFLEPTVWIYEFSDNKFKLAKVARFGFYR